MSEQNPKNSTRSASNVLAEIARAVNAADSASDAVQAAAESLQRYFRTWTLGIWLDDGKQGLELHGLAMPDGYPPDIGAAIRANYREVPAGSNLPGPAAMRARTLLRHSREDAAEFPGLPELMEALDAQSLLSMPIMLDDTPFGCAVMTQTVAKRLTAEEEDLLMHALGLVAIIFQRCSLLERDGERALRLTTLAHAVDHIPLGVKIMDPGWKVLWANPATRDMLGHEPESLRGRSIEELRYHTESAVQEAIDQAIRAGPWSGELLDRHRDGHPVRVHSTIVPVYDATGVMQAIVELERDLTEDHARLSRMEDAYRLAAVGELAAGVAHEVNNPLHAIAATAELLLLESLPEDLRSDINAMRIEAKRGGMIVRNLLAFARPNPPEKTRVDLGEIVAAVVTLRGPQIRLANIEVDVQADAGGTHVYADADQLKQVVHNLIGNASQAIQKTHHEGTIRLRTKRVDDTVEIIVEDTGPGIAHDVLPKIFRPFFTTKEVGEGTGLGLAVSLKLVHENGGELEARNWGRPIVDDGPLGAGGARFVMRFPACTEDLESTGSDTGVDADAKSPPALLRVLVVDDEPTVATVAARYLKRAGYEAHASHTAEEALARLDRGEHYDVMLVDLKMPGMGGDGFYRTIRERDETLTRKIIFASGDIVTPATHGFLKKAGRPVLSKPYDLRELGELIEETLADQ